MTTRLFIIAVTPGIALALGAYLTDRFDREPISMLIKVFILGAVSVIPTIIVERLFMSFNIFGGIMKSAYTAFIVAGLVEEYFKREVVLRSVFRSEAFNEKLDGIIYAVYSALGFATIENISYVVFRFAYNPYVGIFRGILSVPAHMLFAITMGYYLSLAKFAEEEKDKRVYLRRSLTVPVIFHGIFDFILLSGIPFAMIIFVPFVIYLWVVNLRRLNEYYVESKALFKRPNKNNH
ncbi:PrsW family intramembrane metalloprotease [Haloimpatiens sp. FM7330]|uniref:PrsW family intramembrane metalloprotease n=1 Tax=Haloimpatiens sp. FM7330 TaxID=3298610 RepID=UPI003631F117